MAIPGTLLINAQGEVFFLEGGIGVHRVGRRGPDGIELDSIQGSEQLPKAVSLLPDGTLQTLENLVRQAANLPPRQPVDERAEDAAEQNIGPMLFQAYSVQLTREGDDSNLQTANDSTVDS